MAEPVQFDLGPDDLPAAWFNIVPDMVGAGMQPLPPLHPGTREPIGPADLAPLFPESLIMQEVSTERWIDIPGPVLDVYRLWRPTPLYRARRLEQALQTPAHIYFKYEGTSPAGSHKPNTAIAQAYYNKEAGDPAAHHRDRGRAVGVGAVVRLPGLRAGVPGVHGEGLVPAEAVPAGVHGDVRGDGPRLAQRHHAGRQAHPRPTPRLHGFAGHRHQRGGRGRRHERRHQLLAWGAC